MCVNTYSWVTSTYSRVACINTHIYMGIYRHTGIAHSCVNTYSWVTSTYSRVAYINTHIYMGIYRQTYRYCVFMCEWIHIHESRLHIHESHTCHYEWMYSFMSHVSTHDCKGFHVITNECGVWVRRIKCQSRCHSALSLDWLNALWHLLWHLKCHLLWHLKWTQSTVTSTLTSQMSK